MNQITVRYFASIREAMGTGSEGLQTTAATVGALRAELMGKSEAAAQALAERYHRAGWRLALVARREFEIKSWADALGLSADSYEI